MLESATIKIVKFTCYFKNQTKTKFIEAMRTSKFMLALAVATTTLFTANAQTADEIVAKHIEANGGVEKLKGQTSRIVEMTGSAMGFEFPVVISTINGKAYKQEVEVQGMKMVTAVNGNTGWAINPMGGSTTAQALPEDQVKANSGQIDLTGSLCDYKEKGNTVELLGKETIDGAETFKLKVVQKDGSEETKFIDAKTYFLVKQIMKVTANGETIEIPMVYSNYKMVDGVAVAHTMEVTNAQAGTVIMTVKSVKVNPVIDEAIFMMPKN